MYSKDDNERRPPAYARKKAGVPPPAKTKRGNPSDKSDDAFVRNIVFFSITIVGVLCLIIYNSMRITTLSDKTASLKKQLNSYKTQNIQLKYQYEKIYSASAVEEYAQSRLGMTIMDKNYIEYLELPNQDKVERPYKEAKGGFLIISQIIKGFNTIVEYLN